MKNITDYIDNTTIAGSEYLPANTLFLDIETLGFRAETQPVYLIGCASLTEDGAKRTLLFAQNPTEEKEILSVFAEILPHYDTIFTFNGATFDIPYLKKRCQKYGLTVDFDSHEHLDLYKFIRKKKDLLGLLGCKQKDVEDFLNITRKDEMSGGELIEVYKRYSKAPTDKDYDLLVQHNADDVAGMLKLIPMLSYGMLGGVTLSGESVSYIDKEETVDFLALTSVSIPSAVRLRTEDYYMILDKATVKCAFKTTGGYLRYFYDNPKDYVYLINEKKIIPKKLAASLSKEAYRKVLPEECYTPVDARKVTPQLIGFLSDYTMRIIRKAFA